MHSLAAVQAMLLGLALECLLKGLWIKKHQAWLDKNRDFSLTRNGKYVGIPGAGDHDLKQLADAAKLDTSRTEAAVLERLTGFVMFAGRYPIAKMPKLMKPRRTGGAEAASPKYITATEMRLADRLARRLMKEIEPWKK
jgi:hypothetical protein